MRSLLFVAVGVWIGREIYTTLARNQAKEKETKIQKALEKFLQEKLPALTASERKQEIKYILQK